jgi:hypothetical protein
MTRPLRSTPTAPSRSFTATTSRSASATADRYSVPNGVHSLGTLPLATGGKSPIAVPGHAFSRSVREQEIRLTSPTRRTPPGQCQRSLKTRPLMLWRYWPNFRRASTANQRTPAGLIGEAPHICPGFDVTSNSDNDTSPAIPTFGTAHRLPDPHLTRPPRLFRIAPRRSSANAAHGGLGPPRRATLKGHTFISRPAPRQEPRLHRRLPSAFVTHAGFQKLARRYEQA